MTKPFNVVSNFFKNSALASVLMTLLVEPNKYIINLLNTPWNNLNSTAPLLKVFHENIFKETLYDFNYIEDNYGASLLPKQYLDKIFTTNDCIVVQVETVLNKSLEGIPNFNKLKQLEYLQINVVKKNIICKIDPKNLKNNVSVQTLLNSYTSVELENRNLNVIYNVIYNSNYLILDIERIKDYIINSSMIHLNYEIKLKSGKLLYLSGIISHDFIENVYESFILYKGRWYHVNNSNIYTEIGDYKELLKYNNQQVKSSCVLLFYKDSVNRNNVNNASVESNNVIKNKFNYLKKTRFGYGWRY